MSELGLRSTFIFVQDVKGSSNSVSVCSRFLVLRRMDTHLKFIYLPYRQSCQFINVKSQHFYFLYKVIYGHFPYLIFSLEAD